MITTELNRIFLAYDERDQYLYEIGFMLNDSYERRGSLKVIYDLKGEYHRNDYELKYYPLTGNNIQITKKIEALLKMRTEVSDRKRLFSEPYVPEVETFSIQEAIAARTENENVNLAIFLNDEYQFVNDQDTSNRKKNWFFVNEESLNLKDFRFYIDKAPITIEIEDIKVKDRKDVHSAIYEAERIANRAFENSLSEQIWSLFLQMDSVLYPYEHTVSIDVVLGEENFLSEKIEDEVFSEQILTYLKTQKVWLGGQYIDIDLGKDALDINFDTYGLYSDRRDAVYEDDFIDMLLHNPKAYNKAKEFLKGE